MIYTHTSNPSIDYYLTLDQQHECTIYRAKDAQMVVGGKGINVSIVLNEFKVDTVVTTFLGGKIGEWIHDALMVYPHITVDAIPIDQTNRINVKIRGSSEFDINASGPLVKTNALDAMIHQFDGLNQEDIVVVSGSLSPGVSKQFVMDLAKLVHQRNALFILDTSGWSYEEIISTRADLIKPNQSEFDALFPQYPPGTAIEEKANQLLHDGIHRILLSKGNEGAEYFDPTNHYLIHHPAIDAIDTVGCGDSMIAGFLYGWLNHYSLESTLKIAAASGIACAATIALPPRALIEHYIPTIEIKKEKTQ